MIAETIKERFGEKCVRLYSITIIIDKLLLSLWFITYQSLH